MQGCTAHTDLNKKLQGRDGVARAGTLADFGGAAIHLLGSSQRGFVHVVAEPVALEVHLENLEQVALRDMVGQSDHVGFDRVYCTNIKQL